jgi:hypothetical protein
LRSLLLWLATFLVSLPASAGVIWRGDFETGDRSQYTGTQMVSADRLEVVTSPVAEGRYALKATVRQGDDPIDSSGNRNELVYQGNNAAGAEYYYRWKVMFPADYPSVRTWQVFTQWHHEGCCGSPPVEFFVYGEEIRLTLNSTTSVTPWVTKLVRGVWQEFILRVKWSPDPAVGFIELWHNREKVVAKRYLATMYPGTVRNYLKLGLYRSDTVTQVGVVYHDGFIQATQLADVLPPPPPPPPPPDAGTPGPTPTPDAGTPGQGGNVPGSGTPPPSSAPGDEPGVVEPPTDGSVDAEAYGCSAAGHSLLAMALLGLLGLLRSRRR